MLAILFSVPYIILRLEMAHHTTTDFTNKASHQQFSAAYQYACACIIGRQVRRLCLFIHNMYKSWKLVMPCTIHYLDVIISGYYFLDT